MREDGGSPPPPPSPSARVRLVVAVLDDADRRAPAPATPADGDERACLTVLVVAAEADFRRYVRECLRERPDLRLLEAATVAAAVSLADHYSPVLLVVDEPERDIEGPLSLLSTIVIVDDVPPGAPAPGTRRRLLARPFSAEGLMAEIARLLG